jgi:peptidoglycan/xylan/chitin deacetylase (PgdA/CDA1 family)
VLQVALKVDVDTWIGLKEGVPRLLSLFQQYAVPASFFVAFGPDNSGKAIRRLFRPGFLRKMWRTNAVHTYGVSTLLRGTLLPAPVIGDMAPDLLRAVLDAGHELGIHGYDHVLWQDRLLALGQAAISREIERAVASYVGSLNIPPRSFAAPGWQATATSLAVQDRQGFLYCSDTRGAFPFLPMMHGQAYRTLQIPTTLPTLDEVLGRDGRRDGRLNDVFLAQLRSDRLNVHTVHAEVEGRGHLHLLADLLAQLGRRGVTYVRLCDAAEALLQRGAEALPRATIELKPIPGRAGRVASQVVTVRR